jgi:hypothetical protein
MLNAVRDIVPVLYHSLRVRIPPDISKEKSEVYISKNTPLAPGEFKRKQKKNDP